MFVFIFHEVRISRAGEREEGGGRESFIRERFFSINWILNIFICKKT